MSATETDLAVARMAFFAASFLRDGQVAFVGIGTPGLAAMLAQRTHAPRMTLIFESGVIGARPDRLPLSTGSPAAARGADMLSDMLAVFSTLQRGEIDVGLLSGAEVDLHGNLNSTSLGPRDEPTLLLPGSGGAHDIAMLARKTVIVMPHDPRRFVRRVAHVTSPGYLNGGGERARAGLTGGPDAVVTSEAVFTFEDECLTLSAVLEGRTAESVLEGFSIPVRRRDELRTLSPPDNSIVELVGQWTSEEHK